ncbi:hypothetical protein B0A55_02384 [Friedmanniomyces simplex]|uniref:Uncharacterized protein n=1 Tax=Friedmanniomyces simplex TaxID=329884 RepID=A0A4U0XWX7_9PEZI|nr:hypothetical protein B0A55_02384 [Friedmanniomyces simplex]
MHFPHPPIPLVQSPNHGVTIENLAFQNVRIEDLQFEHPPVFVTGDDEDAGYRELMNSLEKEAPWRPLCEAIRRGDENTIREESLHLQGLETLAAKSEAI